MKEDVRDRSGLYPALKTYASILALAWTGVLGVSLAMNIVQERREILKAALIQARTAYDKDVIYRRWNSLHGGVYAPITDETPPNPYLADLPERDITTPSGKSLTLVNPEYMTRVVHEMEQKEFGVRSHIRSLKPVNPANAPDPWEEKALRSLEKGGSEVSSLEKMDGMEYMRLMLPLSTEEGCLDCHAKDGYREGEIRGGISVSVPIEPLWEIVSDRIIWLLTGHLVIWLVGLAGLAVGSRRLLLSERERTWARESLAEYTGRLKEANLRKDVFTDILRHDILSPAGLIKTCSELILNREIDEETRKIVRMIFRKSAILIEIVEDASEYSKLEALEGLECREMDLDRVLRNTLDEFSQEMEEGRVEFDYHSSGECPAPLNPMIAHVFTNLISNAVKYSPEGGKVEVSIDDGHDRWIVSFKDSGEGIPDENKEKVFQRFERLGKKDIKGTGLGLAIARMIVDLHGGSIWVEDNPDGGAIFRVSLAKGAAS